MVWYSVVTGSRSVPGSPFFIDGLADGAPYYVSIQAQDLDGNVSWNPARFINHSCAPNCEAVLDQGPIWIVARRDIPAAEEITFNYGFDLEDYRSYPCRCGAGECVGYIVAEAFFEHLRQQQSVSLLS